MAPRAGRYASVTVNTKDLSTYTNNADFDISIDDLDTSTFGVLWKTHIPGQAGGTLNIAGNYDPTAVSGPAVVFEALVGADPFAVVLDPAGGAGGGTQRRRSFNAILTSYKESSPVGGKVAFAASMVTTGTVTLGATS